VIRVRGKLATRRIDLPARLVVAGAVAVLAVYAWPALAQAAAPSVSGIAPTVGPAAGGTQVTIAGSGFTSDSTVSFGTATVTPTVVSSTELTAISPAGTGTVDVRVTNLSGTSATSTADQFTYAPVPAVTGLSPNGGPTAGGTTVTISGSGFTASSAVTFGGISVGVTVNSSTSLTVVSPGGSGTVNIIVITPGGSSVTGPGVQFTYGVPTTPPGTAPTVTTGSATQLSQTRATLHGSVNPGNQKITSCHFEYGTNTRFALSAACSSGSGTPKPVYAKLTALTPGTTYHYRLAVTTSAGTTTGAPMTFTTQPQPVVAAPRVGLLLSRVQHSRYIAELLGIQGIIGGVIGQSLVLHCVADCQHPLMTTIPLRQKPDLSRKIGLSQGLLVSTATRIVIDLVAKGQLSDYASFAFFISRGTIAVKIAKTGCIRGTSIQKCPPVPATA
jgi:hypothetical protein